MTGLPLHPMLVHLPLALAAIVPIAALLALGAVLRRHRSERSFVVAVVALQIVLALGAVAALRSGEAEEERVEAVVSEAVIETHEEAAEVFVVAAWIALAVSLVPALWPRHRVIATVGAVATVVTTAVVLGLGVRVGEAGAELVYGHGAASVYVADNAAQGSIGVRGGELDEEDDSD